jgi:hypothetical protein
MARTQFTVGVFIAAAAWFLAAAGCSGKGDTQIQVSFMEFRDDVVCGGGAACVDGAGNEVGGTEVTCEGFMSAGASRFSPNGAFLFWSYVSGDRYIEVEIDFPTNVAGDVPSVTSLREFRRGEQVFRTDCSRGIVNVMRTGSIADPRVGSFELMFLYYGPDGTEGTEDDEVRFLRSGLYEPVGSTYSYQDDYYYDEQYRDHWSSGVRFEIWIVQDVSDEGTYDSTGEGGCEGDTYDGDNYDAGEGCEGDTYDDSGDEYDSGCGDETWDSGGDGCEDSSGESSGCEGDSSGSSEGCDFDCEGDTYYSRGKQERPAGTSWAGMMPLLVPFLLRGLLGKNKKNGR